jgi:hypothetical protein
MANISPGVYTKIIDLSTYVSAVPSTIGLICALTEKGEDNTLKFIGSRSELISEFGEPNIATYGKNYGQGLYNAYNYLGESGSLYFMRCMSDDASYANMRVDAVLRAADATASINITYVDSVNTKAEINTNLAVDGNNNPICMLYPIGRGEYYNALSVVFTAHSNPLLDGVYVMDIYEKQSDGDDVIIESFEISFDPTAMDATGDSMWITYILATYSSFLRADMTLLSEAYAPGYDIAIRTYDKSIGTVTADLTGSITDNKQDFADWETNPASGNANFMVIAKDAKGNKIYGWTGLASGDNDEIIAIYDGRDLDTASLGWNGATVAFDVTTETSYIVKKSDPSIATAFPGDPLPLKKGIEGTLKDAAGDLDTTEAVSLLANGYAGTIDDSILDFENVYFTIVFDCGYPSSVKTQISSLVQTRRDCVAILDNGDNTSYTAAMTARNNDHTFNNYFCALYEEYNKVYDIFTGQDVWFSPVYHMSYLLPRNDNVAEVWYAAAGFNRAAIDTIKELRFNPRLGQRDQMYLKQLNPIVKFNPGYTVWGQLTTQAKASALQDLNIVRLVLYCKRALEEYARYFIFEMNDAITWNEVSGDIVEFLEDIKKRRGLYSYSVSVGASEYEIKTKTFHIDIVLFPVRTVEKIALNFFIK